MSVNLSFHFLCMLMLLQILGASTPEFQYSMVFEEILHRLPLVKRVDVS